MKTPGKLKINPERIIMHEELIALKGGYDGCNYYCYVREYFHGPILLEGRCCLGSAEACVITLANLYGLDTTCWPINN